MTQTGLHPTLVASRRALVPSGLRPSVGDVQAVANSLSLLRWQRHQKPWDRLLERQGGLPEHDDLSGSHAQQGPKRS